jgi:hypothetical protein
MRKRPTPDLVEWLPGLHLRPEFEHMVPLADGLGSCTVHIRTDPTERTPRLVGYSVHLSHEPVIAELPESRVRQIAHYAVVEEARARAAEAMMDTHRVAVGSEFSTLLPGVAIPEDWHVLDQAKLDRVRRRAATGVRGKPGRRPISDEVKLRVLHTFRTKGLQAAVDEFGKAERTIRRYISDAKRIEEGRR